ncbi:bacteriophage holin [Actinokineospora bangkokensis]|uniref:Uncharacterized protein n=1 Tax=Actinokineospora bangkokensis TaxID=1193682 RepID=A0A1Q9LN45_9PSEU|nr:bacteriophage holin [Actinokineospora bangkokensis]OLR93435.1 hypothetical protein BJP25_14075 [Actinokineospora bangkokensis]
MLYLLSAALVVVGLTVVVVAVVRVLRGAGRTRSAVGAARSGIDDQVGLLRARTAALRVALADRVPSGKRTRQEDGR